MQNNKLGSSIAVMNAKGGVGKSTVTLAIAETLSYYHGKKVLVIDSDAQMSISVMLMPFDELNAKRANWQTLVGLLHQTLILGQTPDWKEFVTHNVSDVDETETIDLLPGDLRLTLIERAVTEADRHEQMRGLVRSVLAEARLNYDTILIDCPPGLSLLTEIWLREADFHLAPAKPDFLAIAGLEMFREFKKINPELKMAENLGILVNMKNAHSIEDDKYHDILANDEESRCFPEAIPHMAPIQHAARYNMESRSFTAKYPGSAGAAFRNTVDEMLRRTGQAEETHAAAGEAVEFHPAEVVAEPEIYQEPQVVVEQFQAVEPAAPVFEEIEQVQAAEVEDIEVPHVRPKPVIELQSEPSPAVAGVHPAPVRPAGIPHTVEIASRFAPEPEMVQEVSAVAVETPALSVETPQLVPVAEQQAEIPAQLAENGPPRPMPRPQDA